MCVGGGGGGGGEELLNIEGMGVGTRVWGR